MKYSNCFYMLVAGMLLLGACIDPVTIEGPGVPSSLVVEGWFTNKAAHNYVKLSRTTTFTNEFPYAAYTPPVSGAAISLLDSEGRQVEILKERESGFYPITAVAEPGKAYQLEIILGDTLYRSAIETAPQPTGIHSFEVVLEERDKIVGSTPETETIIRQLYFDVSATISTPEDTDNYFLWKNRGIFEFTSIPFGQVNCNECLCWAPDLSLNREVNVLSDQAFTGNEFRHTIAAVEFDRNTRYLLTVEQYAINAAAYEYWNALYEQQTNTGSIFDPVPRRISSNIFPEDSTHGRPVGYFTVAQLTEAQYMLNRNRIAGELGVRPIRTIEAIEGDCRVQEEGATAERPPGF